MKNNLSNGLMKALVLLVVVFGFLGCQEEETGPQFPREVEVVYSMGGLGNRDNTPMGTFGIIDPITGAWNIEADVSIEDTQTKFGFNNSNTLRFTKTVNIGDPLGIQITDFYTTSAPTWVRIVVDNKEVAIQEIREIGTIDRLYAQYVFGAENQSQDEITF